jgi:hypothetical protein
MISIVRESSTLIYALFAAVGFLIVIFATDKFGPGISPDSINYIAAARSFANGQGFQQYDASPFTHWPPLFPIILGGGGFLGYDILNFARVFNAITFGLSIFWFGKLASRVFPSPVMAVVTTAIAMLSFPLLKMFVMVWSEPIFILLVLIFVERLGRLHVDHSRLAGFILVLAGLAAFACLQRYVGIALVLAGAISLLRLYGLRWRFRLIAVGTFCLLSILPLFLWVARNQALIGEVAGTRTPSSSTLLNSIQNLVVVWTNWFLPYHTPTSVRIAIFVVVIGFVVAFAFLYRDRAVQCERSEAKTIMVESGTVLCAYCLLLIIIANSIQVEPISQRYLSPIFPIFLLLAFKSLGGFAEWCDAKGLFRNRAVVLSLIIAFLMLGQSAATASQVVSIWREEGAGDYTQISWEESELIRWLQRHPVDGQIYSNAADLIYFKTGVVARPLPVRGADMAVWHRTLPANVKHYGAWFGQSFRAHMVTPKELASVFELKGMLVSRNEAFFEIQYGANEKR